MNFPLLSLAVKSLRNRRLTSALTVTSIAVSVTLLLGIEKIRTGARESFRNTISQTDLIVGARGGSIQLLLYSVFRIGNATNNISYQTYEKFKHHPAVAWTIPYSLGDSHRGYRVVGTDGSFYENYRFLGERRVEIAVGKVPAEMFDVALGSEVAAGLHYRIGDHIVLAHGVSDGPALLDHREKPFTVVGILQPTGNPIDRSVYITLEGMEAIHVDWQQGAPPLPGQEVPAAELKARSVEIGQITAFLLRTKSRVETLSLQREINTYADEALSAIIPGVTLMELWTSINYAEVGLQAISGFVVIVGLLGMLTAIYGSLNERRREMAILRAIGMGARSISFLLVAEAFVLAFGGVTLGVALTYLGLWLGQSLIQNVAGLYIPVAAPTSVEIAYISILLGASILLGLVPAYRAYRNSLVDGLALRV